MSTVRIVLLAAAGLLVVCGAAFGASELLRSKADVQATVARPVREIRVVADAGDVDIRAGLTGNVVIARKDSWLLDRPHVTTTLRNGVLMVRTACGGLRSILRCRSDLTIDAPPEVDTVVRTDAGDVDLRGLSGRADVQTSSGDIRTHRLEPVVMRARTDAGDVSLDLFGAPARTEARSDAGNVHIVVPYGPYRVDATTDAGSVKVEGLLRDDLAPQAIHATTMAGDIVVRAR
jgi:hypothetical protein